MHALDLFFFMQVRSQDSSLFSKPVRPGKLVFLNICFFNSLFLVLVYHLKLLFSFKFSYLNFYYTCFLKLLISMLHIVFGAWYVYKMVSHK